MKKTTLLIIFLMASIYCEAQQTMTFNSGASEPGFTFNSWNSAGGAIYMANLAVPSTFSYNSGTFNFISFDVTGFNSNVNIQITSNLGNSYTYNTSTSQTHTLNWNGVSSISFSRISSGGSSSDHDNFVYSTTVLSTENQNLVLSKSSVFPNPTSGFLNIESSLNIDGKQFKIYNTLGKVVVSGMLKNNEIDVSSLKAGLYFLGFESKDLSKKIKFIKK